MLLFKLNTFTVFQLKVPGDKTIQIKAQVIVFSLSPASIPGYLLTFAVYSLLGIGGLTTDLSP